MRACAHTSTGDYLIVSSASHDFVTSAGDKGKVKYMVESILYRDQVKHLKEKGLWCVSQAMLLS